MIGKLIKKIEETKAPIVVGLDPALANIPVSLLAKHISEKGETFEAAADAVWEFNKAIIDAVYDLIPAVKPQIAMYEALGLPGLYTTKSSAKVLADAILEHSKIRQDRKEAKTWIYQIAI